MNWDEYNILFHKLNLNRVAFKEVIDCSKEILTLVNAAIDAAAQEKKQWVGLTDEDIKDIVGRNDPGGIGVYTREIFKKIEDKLQEKNT